LANIILRLLSIDAAICIGSVLERFFSPIAE